MPKLRAEGLTQRDPPLTINMNLKDIISGLKQKSAYTPPPDGIDDYGSLPASPPPWASKDKLVELRLSLWHLWWIEWRLRVHLNSYLRVEWPAMKQAISEAIAVLGSFLEAGRGPDIDQEKLEAARKRYEESLYGAKRD